ncbi:MAG: hypothetical protein HYS33_04055 [Acidobacteria bacterium]|nr:hypothetical protein [Acidobacteriota bacterium]
MPKTEKMAFTALAAALTACALAIAAWRHARTTVAPGEERAVLAPGEWMKGTAGEQLHTVEKQLRGLDVSMAEIGYRFTELYFAGQDGNWDYAKYQAEKIDLALRLALERRPKRGPSAQPFLNEDLPFVQQAIERREGAGFHRAMERLRSACMKCHNNEKVPYFTVEFPERRISPVRTIR